MTGILRNCRFFILTLVVFACFFTGCGKKTSTPTSIPATPPAEKSTNEPIWPRFRGDNKNTGRSSFPGPVKTKPLWKFNGGGRFYSSPAIASDGAIVIGSHSNRVFCVNPDGSLRWQFEGPDWFFASPSIDGRGNIYIGCENKEFFCIDSEGKLRWKFRTDGEIFSSANFSPDERAVYFCSEDGFVYALRDDGSLLWKFNTGRRIFSSPAVDEKGRVFAGNEDGILFCISPEGRLIWKFDAGAEIFAAPAIDGKGRICIGNEDGILFQLTGEGKLLWKLNLKSPIVSSPGILKNDGIIIAVRNGTVHGISREGRILWNHAVKQEISSPVVIDKDCKIYFFSYPSKKPRIEDKTVPSTLPLFRLYCMDEHGKVLSVTAVEGPVHGAPAVGTDGRIYYGSDDCHLHALKDINRK